MMNSSKGFVGEFHLQNPNILSSNPNTELTSINDNFVFTADNLLSQEEVNSLLQEVQQAQYLTVGVDGFLNNYSEGDTIGSYRNSFFNQNVAQTLFERIQKLYPKRDFTQSLNIDHDNHKNWKLTGINPLFRTIKYHNQGSLIPHYDAPYIESDTKRTLVTMVIYLTDNKTGRTRFIRDEQSNLSSYDRDLEDWTHKAQESDVLFSVNPKAGSALIFDHRVLHDSEELINEQKVILRTDLVFEKA